MSSDEGASASAGAELAAGVALPGGASHLDSSAEAAVVAVAGCGFAAALNVATSSGNTGRPVSGAVTVERSTPSTCAPSS